MPEKARKPGVTEVGWNDYMALSSQAVVEIAALEGELAAPEQARMAQAWSDVRLLHAELCRRYGDHIPAKNAQASVEARSVESCVERTIKDWDPHIRLLVHNAAKCSSGVWMHAIARVIQRLDGLD